MDEYEEYQEETSIFNPIFSFFSFIGYVFGNYGWYLLILAIAAAYMYRKFQPAIEKYYLDKAEKEYAAKYHKDPDLWAARMSEQQSYAQKLQEKYDQDAIEYKKKMEEKEARKREELLAKYQEPQGQMLGSGKESDKDKTKSLKPEYNPLMGGPSNNYRPQRKSPCSGGGCGR